MRLGGLSPALHWAANLLDGSPRRLSKSAPSCLAVHTMQVPLEGYLFPGLEPEGQRKEAGQGHAACSSARQSGSPAKPGHPATRPPG